MQNPLISEVNIYIYIFRMVWQLYGLQVITPKLIKRCKWVAIYSEWQRSRLGNYFSNITLLVMTPVKWTPIGMVRKVPRSTTLLIVFKWQPILLHRRGFCYFNSVAIAARLLRLRMSVEKVLIVDWVCFSVFNVFQLNLNTPDHSFRFSIPYFFEWFSISSL